MECNDDFREILKDAVPEDAFSDFNYYQLDAELHQRVAPATVSWMAQHGNRAPTYGERIGSRLSRSPRQMSVDNSAIHYQEMSDNASRLRSCVQNDPLPTLIARIQDIGWQQLVTAFLDRTNVIAKSQLSNSEYLGRIAKDKADRLFDCKATETRVEELTQQVKELQAEVSKLKTENMELRALRNQEARDAMKTAYQLLNRMNGVVAGKLPALTPKPKPKPPSPSPPKPSPKKRPRSPPPHPPKAKKPKKQLARPLGKRNKK